MVDKRSDRSRTNDAISYCSKTLGDLLFSATDEEIEELAEKEYSGNNDKDGAEDEDIEDAVSDVDSTPPSSTDGMGEQNPPGGNKSERWYDNLEEKISNNHKRSIENRMMLERIDFRTVWLMRIVIGISIAIVARLILLDLGIA